MPAKSSPSSLEGLRKQHEQSTELGTLPVLSPDSLFFRNARHGRQFPGRLDYLARQVVGHAGFIASSGQVGGAEQLFLAVAQGVADGLLHLRIGEVALPGGFASDQAQDAVTIAQGDRKSVV